MTTPTKDEQSKHQRPIRFLLFSGSLRNDSLNTRLALLAKNAIEKNGGEVDLAKINEFDCPSYNQDLEKGAMPSGAVQLREIQDAAVTLYVLTLSFWSISSVTGSL